MLFYQTYYYGKKENNYVLIDMNDIKVIGRVHR